MASDFRSGPASLFRFVKDLLKLGWAKVNSVLELAKSSSLELVINSYVESESPIPKSEQDLAKLSKIESRFWNLGIFSVFVKLESELDTISEVHEESEPSPFFSESVIFVERKRKNNPKI